MQRLSVTVEVLRVGVMIVGVIRVGVMIVGVISVGVMTAGVLSVGVMTVEVLSVGVMTLSRTHDLSHSRRVHWSLHHRETQCRLELLYYIVSYSCW